MTIFAILTTPYRLFRKKNFLPPQQNQPLDELQTMYLPRSTTFPPILLFRQCLHHSLTLRKRIPTQNRMVVLLVVLLAVTILVVVLPVGVLLAVVLPAVTLLAETNLSEIKTSSNNSQ
jgi:hypothetical protein